MYNMNTAANKWQYLQQQKTKKELEAKRRTLQQEFARLRQPDYVVTRESLL